MSAILDEAGGVILDESGGFLLDEVPWPSAPLDLRADMLLSGGTWASVTAAVYQRDGTSPPVTVTRGRPDESSQLVPAAAAFELNNRSGNFSPKNPLGQWYGQFGRNTQIRFSVPAQQNYLRLEDTASAAICADSAALQITGDIDVQADIILTGTGPYGAVVASKGFNGLYGGTQTSFTSWVLYIGADATIGFDWSANGTFPRGTTSQVPIPARGRVAIRATLSVSTGTVTFYTAATIAGPFTQLGPAFSPTLGAATSIYAATALPLSVGSPGAGATASLLAMGSTGMCGRVLEVRVRSGIAGTLVADPVFSAQAAGVTSFTDAQANAWALYGTAEVSSRDYRFCGELSALPPRWDNTGNDLAVAAQAGGITRRLTQGTAPPLRSAMYRSVSAASQVAAYWPMEDGTGAASLASASGGTPMSFSGSPNLASSTAFACSAPLPVCNGAAFIGNVPAQSGWTDTAVQFLVDIPAGGDTNGVALASVYISGTPAVLVLTYTTASGGTLTMTGFDATLTLLFTTAALTGVNGVPYLVQVTVENAGGGNVTAQFLAWPAGSANGSGASSTVAGTLGPVRSVYLNTVSLLTGTAFGHLAVFRSSAALPLVPALAVPDGTFTGPLAAWAGEPAGQRAGRLCAEQGIPFRGTGSLSGTTPMGAQGLTDFMSLLQECEDADRGLLFEPRTVVGIGYRARSSMCNQAAAATLDYSLAQPGGTNGGSGDSGLDPAYDDQRTRNDWTVSRPSGSSARVTLADGSAMSISAPPAGVGDYGDSLSANVWNDTYLQNIAGWLVNLGTVDEARWPSVPANLARTEISSALYYQLLSADEGDRLDVVNLSATTVSYDPVRQLAYGFAESLGGFHHEAAFACVPERPYEVAADGAGFHLDTDRTTLGAGVSSGATSLSLVTAAGFPVWTTAAGDFPFDVMVSGERMTVTNITGASSPQTATVTRSVNGVVKAQASGAAVHVWPRPVIAL